MDSRYSAFIIPRRPVTSAALPADPPPPYSALPGRPPLPPRLRSSKSATRLQERQKHQLPELPPPFPLSKNKSAATLPPGFVFDDAAASHSPSPPPPLPVRRAKSSVDLRRPQTSAESTVKTESSWKKALGEAQYFAGGLMSSPVESTRHHSIIRHSGALVWYRGPDTSVTITVLSDEPLPQTRTLWLQQKGYSGSMGMSLKAMVGTTSSWLDVTPSTRAEGAHIPVNEERGIQRDLKRFIKKATGRMKGHVPRETHIVRIPAAAQDGYFRIVVCQTSDGKKVLGGSPVFRLASTSADVSVLRGAGLRSMPLEVGAKMASVVGSAMVTTYAGAATGAAKAGVGKVASVTVKKVGQQAYRGYEMSSAMMEPTVGIVGGDEGPELPFPIKFSGRVVKGSGYTAARYGFPTANLVDMPEELTMRMTGTFAAWVRIKGADEGDLAWNEAIVGIAPAENAPPRIVSKNLVAVHILHEFDEVELCGESLQVLLMGFLRPVHGAVEDVDAAMQRHADDLLTTLATLARQRWQPQETRERLRTRRSERGWSERLDGVTGMLVARVDRVPMHKAGIRSEAGALRDASYGNGGLWIRR
ncbi:LipA and NB-ARC domain protein [Akanthomyces lecanii RCEF 1005]|uniref:Riboflavin kinase n=1 Tax=Akanthomyces lecanii RCEF 1005 TaxID=1081108 RepID=A0A168CR45_CORDF|nr:LipA and NB-ARC domain protein [Akanthomyces lecanii RCEF 1005]